MHQKESREGPGYTYNIGQRGRDGEQGTCVIWHGTHNRTHALTVSAKIVTFVAVALVNAVNY